MQKSNFSELKFLNRCFFLYNPVELITQFINSNFYNYEIDGAKYLELH